MIRKDCRSVLAACGPSSVNTKSLMHQSGELRQTLISIIAQIYINFFSIMSTDLRPMFYSSIGRLLRQPSHTSRQSSCGDANWCIPKPTASSYTCRGENLLDNKMKKLKWAENLFEGNSYCTNKFTLAFFPRFSLQYMNYGCRDTRTQMKKKTKGGEKGQR